MKRDKVYISGKISDLDIKLVDIKFQRAEDLLISKGFEVVNPRKLDHSANTTESWSEYMRVDLIALLEQCDKIYYLDCWQNSTGATVEFELSRWLGITTLYHKDVIAMPDVDVFIDNIGKLVTVYGYRCKICGSFGHFDKFPNRRFYTEHGKESDTFCFNDNCDGQNDDLIEITTKEALSKLRSDIKECTGDCDFIAACLLNICKKCGGDDSLDPKFDRITKKTIGDYPHITGDPTYM